MIKHEDIQDDMIIAIKELHLENDQLRNQLNNVITLVREMQNEYIALTNKVNAHINSERETIACKETDGNYLTGMYRMH